MNWGKCGGKSKIIIEVKRNSEKTIKPTLNTSNAAFIIYIRHFR